MKMKCANELIEIRDRVVAEREARLDEECREAYAKIQIATVQFCEEVIGAKLEEAANYGKEIRCEINCGRFEEDRLNNIIFSPLVVSKNQYVTKSYGTAYEPSKEKYSITMLEKYLDSFCFEVSYVNIEYTSYYYGKNGRKGEKIIIKAKKKC